MYSKKDVITSVIKEKCMTIADVATSCGRIELDYDSCVSIIDRSYA